MQFPGRARIVHLTRYIVFIVDFNDETWLREQFENFSFCNVDLLAQRTWEAASDMAKKIEGLRSEFGNEDKTRRTT